MIQKIEYDKDKRIETGPVQFGDDWPGMFIRGDNAGHLALCIKNILDGSDDIFSRMYVEAFVKQILEEVML